LLQRICQKPKTIIEVVVGKDCGKTTTSGRENRKSEMKRPNFPADKF
jgi:hypothetical protein